MISNRRSISFILIIVFTVGFFGCKATEKTTEGDEPPTDEKLTQTDSEIRSLLDDTRSQLSDLYLSQKQEIPKAFLQAGSSDKELNSNPYDGFRVQILSTRNKELADSVASAFQLWADTTIAGYQAGVYQSFRQPYYKVRVGDFHEREQANQFSRLVKYVYPDAWVVHDRIEPSEVPADTVIFKFKDQEASSTDSFNE